MQSRERTTGVVLILLALLIAAGATGYVLANWQPELELDADRCPPSPAGTWMVDVDHTDIQPPIERERIIKGILSIAERMRKNERLELHVITGRPDDVSPPWKGFQKCKSADPASVNAAHENERLVRAEFDLEFLTPLQSLLPELSNGRVATQSPILEAIEISMWSPHFRTNVPNRTLVIFSDLLQTKPFRDPCRVLASEIGARLKGHGWRGVRVIIEYLRNPRDAARQGPEHLRAWVRLFYLLGASQVFDSTTLVANDTPACPKPRRANR